jgi:hypothetical protein
MHKVFHTWIKLCESICDDETTYAMIVIRAEGGVV